MNVFKYCYPLSVYQKMNKHMPHRATFGTIDKNNPEMVTLTQEFKAKLVATGLNLNSITQQEFGISFDEQFDQYKIFPYKIYDYIAHPDEIDIYEVPLEVDFKTDLKVKFSKKLHPKNKGKPTLVEYFEHKRVMINPETMTPVLDPAGNPVIEYINLICKVDFEFIFDPIGFIFQKKAILRWYRTDGSLDEEPTHFKDLGQIYDPILDHEARIEEGQTRRQAMVNSIQLPVFAFLKGIYPTKTTLELLSIGREFMTRFDNAFRNFVDSSESVTDPEDPNFGRKVIHVLLEQATDPWLGVNLGGFTPRAYIINELTP